MESSIDYASPTETENQEDDLGQTPTERSSPQDSHSTTIPTQQHRPERVRNLPQRFGDYEVQLPPSLDHSLPGINSATSTVHPLSHFISYKNFSNTDKAFLTTISMHDEPKHFSHAVKDIKWQEAMKNKIQALNTNNTWILMDLPLGKKSSTQNCFIK